MKDDLKEGQKSFYITTPIYYPNANLHMGHAYTTTICDILARYHRDVLKEDTYFLTGSDENTEKMVRTAATAGMKTDVYLNDVVEKFKELFKTLNISYDQFIRTSDEKVHWPGVTEMWKRLVEAGDIEKRSYEGLYCVGHEAFITEKELVNGKCPDHDEVPQKIKEENYFFKLSKYTDTIKEKIVSGEFEIIPQTRKNEILAQLERGLEDVSFSRPAEKMSVGVPVPGDPTQKIYVWCDALTNYISALGFGQKNDELFKKFWPANAQVIGKDILRFHAAIWPGMLLSAGIKLPKRLLVHGFITSEGKKMSKSLGNVIDPNILINDYGVEAVRYYLARHVSSFEDSDLTYESFKEAYNAGLANGLGNLVSRIMKMAETNLEEPVEDMEKYHLKDGFYKDFYESMDSFEIQKTLNIIWVRIAAIDFKIQHTEPFKEIKIDREKGINIIKDLVRELYTIAYMLEPILPETSQKIMELVKSNKSPSEPLFLRKD
jgi:methionyl-tRNA synthetase